MNPQQQVATLEGLLARIKRNAALPRPAVAAPAPQPVAPGEAALASSIAELDEPGEFEAEAPSPPPAATASDLAAIEPPPQSDSLEDTDDLELIEDEIIDITDLGEAEAAAVVAEAVEAEVEEAPLPSSSPRPKVAAESMDEALASAAEQLSEGEREVPLKTPPPESGDQEMVPLVVRAGMRPRPPSDDLLEVGEELPHRELGEGPTPEQLGETVELDEPLGPALELDTAKAAPPVAERPSPLEQPLVSAAAGALTDDLELPPEAAADLAERRLRMEAPVPPPVPLRDGVAGVQPEIVRRPAIGVAAAAFAEAASNFRPRSFAELLDESLSL